MPSSTLWVGTVVVQVLPVNKYPQKMEKMNPQIVTHTRSSRGGGKHTKLGLPIRY